jgi:prepilin-type N-terminal cleavage/methylation domain-containing protein
VVLRDVRDYILKMKMQKNSGFSLIEIIMVIAVLGTTLIIVIPRFADMLSNMNTFTVVRQVESDLNYCREWALNRRDTIRVEFNTSANPAQNGYTIHVGDSLRLADGSYGLSNTRHPFHPDRNFIITQQLDNVNIQAATFVHTVKNPVSGANYSAQNLFFDNMGKPILTSDGVLVVNGKTITIDFETGELTIN